MPSSAIVGYTCAEQDDFFSDQFRTYSILSQENDRCVAIFFWWEGLFCVQLARLFLFENKLARLFVFAAYNTNSMTLFDETAYLNCSNSPTATYIYIFCTSTSICYIHVPISMSISTSITISISISTVCLICDPDWQTTLHTNSRPLVQHDS